ncbi:MAG: HEAT repeat domain-containing protein [Bdellovibrionales bacterium]|nr:HEAT repeat domain-containing protein [Bdellovibrionales bacterium]NQZ20375.1 HEAT repeat domain-containing protein [Bdellovibrionales bacterium]
MKQLLVVLLLWPVMSWSAIPPQKQSQSTFERALQAPLKIAVAEIYKMGPKAYRKLNNMAFDSANNMNTRWKSFMVMTSIGKKKSLPEIDKALRDDQWYMRSAGLIAMSKVYRKKSLEWAQFLLKKDPALLVRLKAVEVLSAVPGNKYKKLFWSKLYSKENFHRKQSLWIREKLVSHLADYPQKSDLKLWKKALSDTDEKIQAQAVRALEKLSGKVSSEDPETRISLWQEKLAKSTKL